MTIGTKELKHNRITMNDFVKSLFGSDRHVIRYTVLSVSVIIVSYLVYLFLNEDTVIRLGKEDGLFEYLTALSFLVTAVLFFIIFLRRKRIIHLLFALIFFFGMGEEVSWGQRIFNYQSPEYFKENNLQDEFNLHNLKMFDSKQGGGQFKKGISYFLSVNFLYKFFWLAYGVVLPVLYLLSRFVRRIADKIDLPVPPFILGSAFLFNWIVGKAIFSTLISDKSSHYYYAGIEINEFGSAFVFVCMAAFFLRTGMNVKRGMV